MLSSLVQHPLLFYSLETLDLVANLEVAPVVKPHAALAAFPHLRHVLFDVLQRLEGAWAVLASRAGSPGVRRRTCIDAFSPPGHSNLVSTVNCAI